MKRETPGSIVAALERRLRELGDGARAEGAKAYLKSELDFAGVDTPTLRREVRAFLRARREFGKRELLEAGGRKEIAMLVPVVFLVMPITVLFALYPGLLNIVSITG